MGLLRGSISVTRLGVSVLPEEIDFEQVPFSAIAPGSEVRQSSGFIPFEPDEPYQVGHRRWAFRVRFDTLKPDPTQVRERVRELVAAEQEATGAPFVGAKKRRELKNLAEEELIVQASPQSKIIEGVVDDRLLYLATTADKYIGQILLLLRKVGVIAELKTPWLDQGDPEEASDLVPTGDVSQSVLGCRFVKSLVGDREVMFEPESGAVRLQTREAKVSLTGEVLPELMRYLKRDDEVEILSARLLVPEGRFRLDAVSWRISSLTVETERKSHWIELLDERLEKTAGVFELLDRKYAAFRQGGGGS